MRLRATFEQTGSVGWVMRRIVRDGLDRTHGFVLDLDLRDDRLRSRLHATEAALLRGDADLADCDWLALAHHRAQGHDLVPLVPYGRIFGGLVARRASGIATPADLHGKRLGVVHHADKNWRLLRALAARAGRPVDPARVSLVETGSKSDLRARLHAGELDAALLYWHQLPDALEDPALQRVCDLLDALGEALPTVPPTTFLVVRRVLRDTQPALLDAFTQAYRAAVARLQGCETSWRREVGAAFSGIGDGVAQRLRQAWMARVCAAWPEETVTQLRALWGLLAPGSDAARQQVEALRALLCEMETIAVH